jgi:hypothetical protein
MVPRFHTSQKIERIEQPCLTFKAKQSHSSHVCSMTEEDILVSDKKLCACGCNVIIDSFDKWKHRPRYYKHGHNASRENNHSWKGGKYLTQLGYFRVMKKGHPRADRNGYVFEHDIVYEESHNCCVLKWGAIHHRDGNKQNNVWYNLQGMMHGQHSRLSNTFPKKDMSGRRCSRCGSSKTVMYRSKIGLRQHWFIDKQTRLFLCSRCYKNV